MPMVNMNDYLNKPEYQEYLQQVNGLSPKLPQRKKGGALRNRPDKSGCRASGSSKQTSMSSSKLPLKRKLRLGSAVDAHIGDGTRHFLSCYATFLPFESTLKMFLRLLQEQLWVSESRQRLILDELEGDMDVAETKRLKDQAERFLQVPVEFMLKRYKEVVHAFRQLKSSSCPYYLIENCLVGLCQLILRIYPENDDLPDEWFMLNCQKRAIIEKSVTINAQFLTKLKEYELADILPENLNHVIRLSRLGLLEEAGRLGSRVDQSVVGGIDPLCPLSVNLDSPCSKTCKKYPTCSKQWRDAQFNEATQRYIAQVYNQKAERPKQSNPSPAESDDDEGTGSISSENFPDSECTWPAELFGNDPFPETSFLALLQRVVPKKRRACSDDCVSDGSEKDSGVGDGCRHESEDSLGEHIKTVSEKVAVQYVDQETQTFEVDFDPIFPPDLVENELDEPLSPLALPMPATLPNLYNTDIDHFFQPVQAAPMSLQSGLPINVPAIATAISTSPNSLEISTHAVPVVERSYPNLKRARSTPSPTHHVTVTNQLTASETLPKMLKRQHSTSSAPKLQVSSAFTSRPSSAMSNSPTKPYAGSSSTSLSGAPDSQSVFTPSTTAYAVRNLPKTPSPVQQIKDELIQSSELLENGLTVVGSYMPPTPPSLADTPIRTTLPSMTPVATDYQPMNFQSELPPELAAAIEAARCAPSPPPPIYLEMQTPRRLAHHQVIEIAQQMQQIRQPTPQSQPQPPPVTTRIYSSPRPQRSPEAKRSPPKYREYEITTSRSLAQRSLSQPVSQVCIPVRASVPMRTQTPGRIQVRTAPSPIKVTKPKKTKPGLPKGLPKQLPEILPEIQEPVVSDEEIELDFVLDAEGNLVVDEEALKRSSSVDDKRYTGSNDSGNKEPATIDIGEDFPQEARYVFRDPEHTGVLGLWRHHQISGKGKYWTLKDTISLLTMSKIFGAGQYAVIKDLDLPRYKRFNRREIKARFNNLEKRRIVLRLNDDKSRFFINHPQLRQVVEENEVRQRQFIKHHPQLYPKKSLGSKYAKLCRPQL